MIQTTIGPGQPVAGSYTYEPALISADGALLNTHLISATAGTIDGLPNGSSTENFSIANFSYTTPAIPFAKYYGQWTSIGIDNTFRARTAGNGPIAFTHSVTTSNWFPNKLAPPADSTYPKIYNDLGVENSFSYVKAATAAQAIRNMVFYLDVDNDHLPLRELIINWGDGAQQKIEEDKGEGKGRNDSPPCEQRPWTASNPCDKKKFIYNHTFQNTKTVSFDGREVCITAMDNWEQTTRVCGTLKAPVTETD